VSAELARAVSALPAAIRFSRGASHALRSFFALGFSILALPEGRWRNARAPRSVARARRARKRGSGSRLAPPYPGFACPARSLHAPALAVPREYPAFNMVRTAASIDSLIAANDLIGIRVRPAPKPPDLAGKEQGRRQHPSLLEIVPPCLVPDQPFLPQHFSRRRA
jgi:hypothetical protein